MNGVLGVPMSFSATWARIQRLVPGVTIENWTALKGRRGRDLKIIDVRTDYVTVKSEGARNLQRISRKDFEFMHRLWPSYLAGVTSRENIRAGTRYSTYVISILRHVLGGQARSVSLARRASGLTSYEEKVKEILDLDKAAQYHAAFYKREPFRGPCLHFHRRALLPRDADITATHQELVYAMLAAWGMNQPGRSGPKMQDFETFRDSIDSLRGNIQKARRLDLVKMAEGEWRVLEEVFKNLDVMASGSVLVGNSKVMHHLMPHLVPPIDRTHSLRFLRGAGAIEESVGEQWEMIKRIISDFFIPVISNQAFRETVQAWMANRSDYPWDTSVLKVVDNLIIGAPK